MRRLVKVVAIAAAVVAVGIGAWLVFLREDAPEEFVLSDPATAGAGDTTDDAVVEFDGVWTVASGSEAGYRVVEDLAEVLDFEAVGRTSQVTGTVDITDSAVVAASFDVDIASITSDDSRRDGQFTGPIMNAAEFPTATLVLSAPLMFSSDGTIQGEATGELTLRGVTKPVQFAVQTQVLDGSIEVVASIDVAFSDYGIANPSNPLASVRDEGKVEVRLLLAPA